MFLGYPSTSPATLSKHRRSGRRKVSYCLARRQSDCSIPWQAFCRHLQNPSIERKLGIRPPCVVRTSQTAFALTALWLYIFTRREGRNKCTSSKRYVGSTIGIHVGRESLVSISRIRYAIWWTWVWILGRCQLRSKTRQIYLILGRYAPRALSGPSAEAKTISAPPGPTLGLLPLTPFALLLHLFWHPGDLETPA